MMYKRTVYDIQKQDRSQVGLSDYTEFSVPMPDFSRDATLVGVLDPTEVLKVYNLNSAKRTVYGAPIIDTSSDTDRSFYTGVEASFTSRLPGGSMVFGSWTAEHNMSFFCDTDDNPNGINRDDLYQGNSVPAGGRFCDQRKFHVPFRHEFKLGGNYQLPLDVGFGFVVQSYPGAERVITWQPAQTLFPGASRTNTETLVLNEPGSLFQPRWNQLDVNFKKNFRDGRKVYTLELEYFNILNSNAIFTTNDAVGNSLGQVTRILLGRFPRLAFQMKW
jgi:hypothetical protein